MHCNRVFSGDQPKNPEILPQIPLSLFAICSRYVPPEFSPYPLIFRDIPSGLQISQHFLCFQRTFFVFNK